MCFFIWIIFLLVYVYIYRICERSTFCVNLFQWGKKKKSRKGRNTFFMIIRWFYYVLFGIYRIFMRNWYRGRIWTGIFFFCVVVQTQWLCMRSEFQLHVYFDLLRCAATNNNLYPLYMHQHINIVIETSEILGGLTLFSIWTLCINVRVHNKYARHKCLYWIM